MIKQQARTVETILRDYQAAEAVSKRNMDTVPLKTRSGHEAAIKRAKLELPKLRVEYLTAISKKAYGFFVSGDKDKAEKFVKIAAENGAFVVNAATIYEVLADKIQFSIGGRKEFSVTQVGILERELRDLVVSTGYTGPLGKVAISSLRVVSNREQLVSYVRDLVMKSNGNMPAAVHAQSEIIRQALAQEFNKQRLVVVVTGATNLDRQALTGLFTKISLVDVDSVDEVTERFAKDSIMGVLKPGYVPVPAPKTQPVVIDPATQPTTTEPTQENKQ